MRKILHEKMKKEEPEEKVYRIRRKYFGNDAKGAAFLIEKEILEDPEKPALVIAAEYGISEHLNLVEAYREIILKEKMANKPKGRSLIV